MPFTEKLFGLRKQAGMTQADLAEKLNVSRQTVSRWEMGTAKPEMDTLIALSDMFDVSLDYLLRDKPLENHTEPREPLPPVPQYWDFVPKAWWPLTLLALCFKIIPYVADRMLKFAGPELLTKIGIWVQAHPVIWIFMPPWSDTIVMFLLLAVGFCFLLALNRFLKIRK